MSRFVRFVFLGSVSLGLFGWAVSGYRSVVQDRPSSEACTLTFPQLADGGSGDLRIRSTLVLLNNSKAPVTGIVSLFLDTGEPMILESDQGSSSRFEFTVAPGNAYTLKSKGTGSLRKGWVGVTSSGQLSGTTTYELSTSQGTFLSEVGVGDSARSSALAVPVDTASDRNSGFALCNPSPIPATVSLQLRDEEGLLLEDNSLEIQPFGQIAEFAAEQFTRPNLEEFQGTVSAISNVPISMVALQTRGLNYTSLPSFDLVDPPAEATRLVFARIGDGLFGNLRMRTSILLFNPTDTAKTVSIKLFGPEGETLVLSDARMSQADDATIPGHGLLRIWTSGQTSPGQVGWAEVESDGPISGAATFEISDTRSSVFISEVGVPDSIAIRDPLVFVNQEDGRSTGVALTNYGSEELAVHLGLTIPPPGYDQGALQLDFPAEGPTLYAEADLLLPARSHQAQFIPELFPQLPVQSFSGVLELTVTSARFGPDVHLPLSGLALITRGPKFTSQSIATRIPAGRPLTGWEDEVEELLARMTLNEKIGQMTQADRGALVDIDDIATYALGSLLSGGGSGPGVNRVESWAEMVDSFQTLALTSRLAIPLLYGVDAVHGHNNVFGAVVFPHNIGLGATRNPQLVEQVSRVTASEVRATGINWTFSPCVTVPQDERWGRTYEGFSEDPELVRRLGQAAVLGYQTEDLSDPGSIVACAKHYIGDGGTFLGQDQGNTNVDEETLRRIHLPGYLGALEAGVGTIMVSFSSWKGEKLSSHRYLLTDLLKGELGFQGFLISDWAAIDQLHGTYRDQVRESINAGLDMIMVPYRYREFISTLEELVVAGEVPQNRIDDAVRRILRVKFAAGLFSQTPLTDRSFQNHFGSPGHRELGREAVRQSQVLLKNAGAVLPLSRDTPRVLVAGKSAHNLGNQCGGWTITWQGASGPITTGTTILEAIQATVSPDTTVTYSRWGTGAAMADVAIAVVGETPYAEGYGDRQVLTLDDDDQSVINRIVAAGAPLVLIVVSGRPLILGDAAEKADAILAAWLPGTEALGVADVIFGQFAPQGKLPCSWPRSMSQIPLNLGDEPYDPLYPYGFGLSY